MNKSITGNVINTRFLMGLNTYGDSMNIMRSIRKAHLTGALSPETLKQWLQKKLPKVTRPETCSAEIDKGPQQ